MIGTTNNDDLAITYLQAGEQRAIEAQRAQAGITAFAVVVMIGGKKVELVTQCDTMGRASWRELLGTKLHEYGLPPGATPVDDIDLRWGMAWKNTDGSISVAGPELDFVKKAVQNLQDYQFDASGMSLTIETADANATTSLVATVTEGLYTEEVNECLPLTAEERPFALEVYGIAPDGGDPWGLAWSSDNVLVMVAGNHPDYAHQAFRQVLAHRKT